MERTTELEGVKLRTWAVATGRYIRKGRQVIGIRWTVSDRGLDLRVAEERALFRRVPPHLLTSVFDDAEVPGVGESFTRMQS